MRTKVPGINRAKLVALGSEKIQQACDVHVRGMYRFKPSDRGYRIHQGLLAQCFMAFKELNR